MVKQAFSVSFSSPSCLLCVAHLAFSPSHSLPELQSMVRCMSLCNPSSALSLSLLRYLLLDSMCCRRSTERERERERERESKGTSDGARERESELGGIESDYGAVHERTRSKIPRVDERPSSPPSHRLRAPHPRPGIPDATYLDPRPQQDKLHTQTREREGDLWAPNPNAISGKEEGDEERERAELLGRAVFNQKSLLTFCLLLQYHNGDGAHIMRIFDKEVQAGDSVRNSARMLEETNATGETILRKYAEQREFLKTIVQMCQWFWKCDYKFTYIQSTNNISMHTTQTHGYVPISATSEATTICEYLHTCQFPFLTLFMFCPILCFLSDFMCFLDAFPFFDIGPNVLVLAGKPGS
ncbi:unnamed protein product [Malus baccata var. baccata]